jgi:hypothetical protein
MAADVADCYGEEGIVEEWADASEVPAYSPPPQPLPVQEDLPRRTPHIGLTWSQVSQTIDAWTQGHNTPTLADEHLLLTELDVAWQQALRDDQFVAGTPHTRVQAWETYFAWAQQGQPLLPAQNTVLRWLREGVTITWVPPTDERQRKHPRYQARIEQVRRLIAEVFPDQPEKADQLLQGDQPSPVQFPNRTSAVKHAAFVREALGDMRVTGALQEVTREDLQVISGLGVAVNRKGKLRLVLDATYINLYDCYEAFSYEKLSDVPHFAQASEWLVLTDFKAGYHHLKVHPQDRKFLGIEFEGKFYAFVALPFGLSSACRVYTVLMQQVYAPLRSLGLRMTTYIDDALYVAASRKLGLQLSIMLLCLLTFLGFCLSRGKCQLNPSLQGVFLGLIVDLQCQAFGVPSDKADYILQEWAQAAKKGYTKRAMAKLAGLLVSVSPAVPLAPLYVRRLFQAMGLATAWDELLGEEAAQLADQDHAFWQAMLSKPCHKPWRRAGPVYVCTGDASARGYGGFSPELLPAPMQESFTAEEQDLMRKGLLSSCHREVKNACLLAKTCIDRNTDKLRGATLLIFCDNQGAVANINSLNGKPHTLALLRSLIEQAAPIDLQIVAQWVPRDTPDMQLADHYSRCDDPGAFALAHRLFLTLSRTPLPSGGMWGFCTGDCFAGAVPEFHHSPRFFTKYPAPAGQGADALLLPWSMLDPPQGGVPLLWVFPPRDLVRETIDKIALERKNCIFIIANMLPEWRGWVQHLPIVHERAIQHQRNMFEIGSRFPPNLIPKDRNGKPKQFTCHLTCFLIRYQDLGARKRRRKH